jgi:zinc protease
VKFQSQYFRGAVARRLFTIWLLVGSLGLFLAAGVAHAQNARPSPIVGENQSDLSLLPGAIAISPPGGQRVEATKPLAVWPWESSGETPDPAIVFGRLANGMRYAIKRNNKPENEVALRFRYDVGSNYEDDHQLGYAHFLEHMAFNGSTNIPEGEFVKRMERLGAAFGRHVNASTSNDETIYQLDLPNAGEGRLELALDLFRETADRLTLSQDAIDREKGIVASEQITRSSPMRDRYLERNKRLYPRMRDTNRNPIGTIPSIEGVTSQSLRSFYQRWYRPDRAILVIVGDIDVDATEAMIKDRFASWKPALEETNPPKPSAGQWEDNKLSIFIERSNTEQEEFVIQSERPDPRLFENGSRDEESVRSHVQTIAFNILNQRLGRAATRGDNPPYLSGSYGGPFAGPGNSRGLGWRAQIDFAPRNRDWRGGMKALALEMRQVLRDGFSREERDRAIADYSREMPSMGFADFFDTSTMLADSLTRNLVYDYTPKAKQDRASQRAELRRRLEQVTVARLNEEVRFYWRGVQPRFLITTQDPSVTEASVISAWREALAAPIPPRQVIQPVRFEPLKLGPASRLAGRWREPGLDADFVQFENGVTLVVKPNSKPVTDPAQSKGPDEVAITVQTGAGWLAFGDGDGIWPGIATAEWQRGGFANLKSTDLGEAFRDTGLNQIDTDLGIIRARMNSNVLGTNLNLSLDLMLAKMVSPRLGTDSIGLYADRLRQGSLGRQQTAEDVFRQKRLSLYQTGSPLFMPRTPEETVEAILRTNVAQANGRLRDILNYAPISVIIVGDIDMDTAIKAVGSRFGALPKRRGMETGVAVSRNWRLRDGGGPAQVFQHGGNDDQALVNVAWQVPNVPKGPATYSLDLLKAIFQVRANDVIREAYGQTYSPSVQTSRLPGYGDNVVLAVSAIVLPKDVESVEARIRTIATDLATSGPTSDEVSRARTPLLEAQREECKDNECWVGTISEVLAQRAVGEREARPWRDSADYLPTLRLLTREELQVLAGRYFVDSRLIKVHVLPGAKLGETVAN